ncbi:restriction endonuclease subunit S [Dysgonomonas sp.]|uniref:restriction endonuclease subunit S n=1 Tax=Dysgonomonas sp. TaxID=1891233 RepID=UPI0027BAD974|nr:restriction endonuclease subunit S [Dysgonomonas sp.]
MKKDRKEKGNCPNLRFLEFEGEWVECKLLDIAQKITIKNKDRRVENVISNSAQRGLIPQLDFFDKEIANNDNTSGYYIIENGDYVYNPRKSVTAPYGPVNIYKGDHLGIVSPLYLCFKVKNINKDFLFHFFKSSSWHKFIYLNGDNGARHDRVSIKDETFFKLPVCYPKTEEQNKIVEFLSLIDQRIETQNKIIEELKKLKTALVDKFLKPKIYWKKVRLSNCCSIRNGLSLIQNDSQIGYLVTRIETISHRYIDLNKVGYLETSIDISKYKLNEGDILFSNINSVSHIGKTAFVDKKYNLYHGMNLLRLVTDRSILNPYFLFLILNTPKSINKFQSICNQAVSQASINQTELGKFSFSAPPLSEQNTIAEFFKKIEKSIFLETRKLSCYKKQKLFLMREMFI